MSSISNFDSSLINGLNVNTMGRGESGIHYSNETISSQMIQSDDPIRYVMTDGFLSSHYRLT